MSQSIPAGYIPRATPGDSLKKIPGGRDLTFESCPAGGGREFDKGRDFVEVQTMLNAI